MSKAFQRQFHGAPEPVDRTRLNQLAKQCVDECEAYDRTVCTGPVIDGVVMTRTSDEWRLVANNAHAVRERLWLEVQEMGFTRKEWNLAIMNVRKQ